MRVKGQVRLEGGKANTKWYVFESTTASRENVTGSTIIGKSVMGRIGAIYLPTSCCFLSLLGHSSFAVLTPPCFWVVFPGPSRWVLGRPGPQCVRSSWTWAMELPRCLPHWAWWRPLSSEEAETAVVGKGKRINSYDKSSTIIGTL